MADKVFRIGGYMNKKIGLVGGLGPASTVYYYLGLIKRCQSQNGENSYPKIVIDSADIHINEICARETQG